MVKKMKAANAGSKGITADDLKRVVKEFAHQSASASEYAGHAGQVIKTAIDQHNLDRKALRFTLGLSKMEEVKRQATIRALIEYAHKLDMFAAVDAFDDLIDTMETICADVRSRSEKPRKADPVVAQFMN